MAFHLTTFTITQPFLGAPLQFQPALGTQELDELIDAFVTGSASKQDKLSQVTIDFYNNATVDLMTGALVREYSVVVTSPWSSETPTLSQSSGFSPPIFTPSPASSASFSAYSAPTPPARTRKSKVSRPKARDTKKTAEARLPGFSIMTKDGVDVTSTAGRGTKTKEQREHAHLMRIMKACDECKRKKVRCDPSHRRTSIPSLRTSSSQQSSSSASFSTPEPYSAQPSQSGSSSGSSSAIDDFILFPEGTAASWNPADIANDCFDNQDLSQFSFDINADFSDPSFSLGGDLEFDSFHQPAYVAQVDYQHGLDWWATPSSTQPDRSDQLRLGAPAPAPRRAIVSQQQEQQASSSALQTSAVARSELIQGTYSHSPDAGLLDPGCFHRLLDTSRDQQVQARTQQQRLDESRLNAASLNDAAIASGKLDCCYSLVLLGLCVALQTFASAKLLLPEMLLAVLILASQLKIESRSSTPAVAQCSVSLGNMLSKLRSRAMMTFMQYSQPSTIGNDDTLETTSPVINGAGNKDQPSFPKGQEGFERCRNKPSISAFAAGMGTRFRHMQRVVIR